MGGFICQYNELQYMPSVICFVVVVVVEIIPAVQTNNTWFASSPPPLTNTAAFQKLLPFYFVYIADILLKKLLFLSYVNT